MALKVKLSYFRAPGGKWYTDGEYTTHVDELPNAHLGMLLDEIREMQDHGNAPGRKAEAMVEPKRLRGER